MHTEYLHTILKQGEGETLEFKSSFNNEVIETLVAFANTKGGSVIIGISPKQQLIGVDINEESVQNWVNEIKNKTTPVIVPDVDILKSQGKTFIRLSVKEYPIKPVATRGKYFKRVLNSIHLLQIKEVVNMHLKTFNISWDYQLSDLFKIDDISFDKVQKSIDLYNQSGLQTNDDPLTFLSKKDLFRDGKLSNAAYLLFHKNPSVITTIELGRFQDDITIKDTDRTKEDILTQVDQVIGFVKKHINKEVIITGEARNTQRWQYPLEAIREIVLNMIVHRDYRSSADSIVKVYDNKIEFFNPGTLPDEITVDDLLANTYKSIPRNKLIVDFFKDLQLIEKYGSGIQRVIQLIKNYGLPEPEFENISGGFMVTVYSSKDVTKDVTKDDRIAIISKLIAQNPQITIDETADYLQVNRRTILRDIEYMQKQKLIKRIGGRKNGKWKIL